MLAHLRWTVLLTILEQSVLCPVRDESGTSTVTDRERGSTRPPNIPFIHILLLLFINEGLLYSASVCCRIGASRGAACSSGAGGSEAPADGGAVDAGSDVCMVHHVGVDGLLRGAVAVQVVGHHRTERLVKELLW